MKKDMKPAFTAVHPKNILKAGKVNEQKSLFDLGLQYRQANSSEEFIDGEKKRLNELSWLSLPRQGFFYDENDKTRLALVTMELKCFRRIKKKGQKELVLSRGIKYDSIDEYFTDEIPCKTIDELENIFESEKHDFEIERLLPPDVLFDGRRYFLKFEKNDDGTIGFTEKWFPPIEE